MLRRAFGFQGFDDLGFYFSELTIESRDLRSCCVLGLNLGVWCGRRFMVLRSRAEAYRVQEVRSACIGFSRLKSISCFPAGHLS